MNYIAVDDEPFALRDLAEAVAEAAPGCALACFGTPGKAVEYAGSNPVDAAFLDIELGSTSGPVLAKQLKDLRSETHIIFVTSYEQYAVRAFQLHATGYLMKPATAEDIRRELTFLYGDEPRRKPVRVQTFGGFEEFVDEKPVAFRRAKSKELLAYLVDRRGASVTAADACAALFGDASVDEGKKGYFRTIVKGLRESLRDAGVEDILLRSWNSLAIVPERLDADSYRFFGRRLGGGQQLPPRLPARLRVGGAAHGIDRSTAGLLTVRTGLLTEAGFIFLPFFQKHAESATGLQRGVWCNGFKRSGSMRILVVGRQGPALEQRAACLRALYPRSEIVTDGDAMSAVQYAFNHWVDALYTEVETKPIGGFDVRGWCGSSTPRRWSTCWRRPTPTSPGPRPRRRTGIT